MNDKTKPEAQAAGEPVAWRFRHPVDGDVGSWKSVQDEPVGGTYMQSFIDEGCIIEYAYPFPALTTPASHDAQDGDHWSEFVVIERHWLQNIASAVCLLEQSESILDRREGAALRKLVASARSTPKPEAAGALTPAATPGEKKGDGDV